MEKSPQPSRMNATGSRDPADIHIAILTQTESQQTGLSTIQITIDGQAPEIENFAIDSTAQMFVQQSIDTYKATQVNISMFINILIGIKANGWCLMGTNAFLNSARQEVVKTFYFEKVSGRVSAGATRSTMSKGNSYASTPANNTTGSSSNTSDNMSPVNMTSMSQPSVEGKSSVESVEQRIAAITAAQNARKNFLLQQQSASKLTPAPSSSSTNYTDDDAPASSARRDSDGGEVTSPVGGSILFSGITPRAKTATPGARPAAGTASAASSDIQKKNAEYFKRMKKEQDLEKRKQEEEEQSLPEDELRRRKEQQALQEAHESSKTAHFSRLGATFVTGGGLFGGAKKTSH